MGESTKLSSYSKEFNSGFLDLTTLSKDEIKKIISDLSKITEQDKLEAVSFALTKIPYPDLREELAASAYIAPNALATLLEDENPQVEKLAASNKLLPHEYHGLILSDKKYCHSVELISGLAENPTISIETQTYIAEGKGELIWMKEGGGFKEIVCGLAKNTSLYPAVIDILLNQWDMDLYKTLAAHDHFTHEHADRLLSTIQDPKNFKGHEKNYEDIVAILGKNLLASDRDNTLSKLRAIGLNIT